MNKKNSKSKLALAILSLIITFFVWQQGLKDSLERPSVSNDLAQKEIEITSLALPAVPDNVITFFDYGNPDKNIEDFLLNSSYADLSDRNKLILIILSGEENYLSDNGIQELKDGKYGLVIEKLKKQAIESSFIPSKNFFRIMKMTNICII